MYLSKSKYFINHSKNEWFKWKIERERVEKKEKKEFQNEKQKKETNK